MEAEQKKGSYLTRALAVIEKAALAERPLTPTEINNELQIPKATIQLLETLKNKAEKKENNKNDK